MRAIIEKSVARGAAAVPPSKSLSHRALVCAALASGTSVIRNLSDCDDVSATVNCLRALGAKIEYLNKSTVAVTGTDMFARQSTALDCGESGSTLRFLLPLCLLSNADAALCGGGRLLSRPLSVYEEICRDQGLAFVRGAGGITVGGVMKPGEFTVDGGVSSQFISGLLFSLPLLPADSRIRILPPCESRPYIDLTLQTLRDFGVAAAWENENTLFVKGNQKYTASDYTVEGDWSAAAVLVFLNLFGGKVKISGVRPDSLQGDKACVELFDILTFAGATVNLSDCIDLAPILTAYAAAVTGGEFVGARRLKYKESDRGEAMARELNKFGCFVAVDGDRITVDPADFHAPTEPLCGNFDHRVVTALCALLTLTGGEIDGVEAVNKSWPDFFDTLKALGIKIRLIKDD